MWSDFTQAGRGSAFFLPVLATSIFGLQLAVVADWQTAVAPIWVLSVGLGIVMMIGFVFGVTIRSEKLSLSEAIGPAWFLPGAALEGAVALGTHVFPGSSGVMGLALFGGFLLGLLLNLLLLAAVLYRWLFLPTTAEHLVATNWINMGGFAIVVVAAVKLSSPRAEPFIVLSWAIATGGSLSCSPRASGARRCDGSLSGMTRNTGRSSSPPWATHWELSCWPGPLTRRPWRGSRPCSSPSPLRSGSS